MTKTVLLRVRRARLMREGRRLRLEEVVAKIGASVSQLSRFERCERDLPYGQLKRLAKLYRVKIDDLLEEVLIGADGRLIEVEEPVV